MKHSWMVVLSMFLVMFLVVDRLESSALDEAKDRLQQGWKELQEQIAIKVKHVDVDAEADIAGYKVRLGAEYGADPKDIDDLMRVYQMPPSDLLTAYELARLCKTPVSIVAREYRQNKGKGWGVMAHNLGIKPGSPAFHALKNNDWVSSCCPPGLAKRKAGKGLPPGQAKKLGKHGDDTGRGNKPEKSSGKGKGKKK